VLERPDLCADPRFSTNLDRARNRAAFIPILEAELARWPRATLLARLREAGIPCGEVLGLLEALTSVRSRAAGLVVAAGEGAPTREGSAQGPAVQGPAAHDLTAHGPAAHVLAPPYRLDGARLPVRRMPPALGSAGAEILGERLGLSEAERGALVAKGVLR
jgi:crotonobetainyl-CoA:carnitine CoA-transferase CaiB-like acyl-CoA transferase